MRVGGGGGRVYTRGFREQVPRQNMQKLPLALLTPPCHAQTSSARCLRSLHEKNLPRTCSPPDNKALVIPKNSLLIVTNVSLTPCVTSDPCKRVNEYT
jgi:hypothetical protein